MVEMKKGLELTSVNDEAEEGCPREGFPQLGNVSFSCPHFDPNREYCHRVHAECIPGRPGCVLPATTQFAVPIEERLRQAGETKVAEQVERRKARKVRRPTP